MKILILSIFVVATLATQKVRYDGFKVHQIVPKTESQLAILRQLENYPIGYLFWSEVSTIGNPVHVMVPPHMEEEYKEMVELQGFEDEIYIENVQEKIDNEQPKETERSSLFGWKSYYRLDAIYDWLEDMVKKNPDILTLVEGGQSYESRKIMGVKLSYSPKNENKGVFLEGGIHAREWIAPATITYMLNELVTSSDPKVREIAESHDWYIFPVTNPDGYEYTHTVNRVWRKTRSPHTFCFGVDPNRNWGYHFNEGGTSSNPCAETYSGPKAFSEIETKSLSEYITSIHDKLLAYIGFHSFSQFLLIPYGHTNQHLDNYDELMDIGMKAKKSLASRYGTQYEVGNIVDVIYVASGGSMDWVKGNYKTRITYTYELRDTGRHGFLLPPEQIIPTGEETLDSLVTILEEAAKR